MSDGIAPPLDSSARPWSPDPSSTPGRPLTHQGPHAVEPADRRRGSTERRSQRRQLNPAAARAADRRAGAGSRCRRHRRDGGLQPIATELERGGAANEPSPRRRGVSRRRLCRRLARAAAACAAARRAGAGSRCQACCVPRHARAAARTNTRRASRSGAHIRACSSAGRVLAERCLGISRLVVLVCVRQQLMWVRVGRASVPLPAVRGDESGLALTPSGADGAPQRRTEMCHTENEKPRCTCPSRRIIHTAVWCV